MLNSKNRRLITAFAAAVFFWWLFSYDARIAELNELLKTDRELTDYPYQFEVIELENGVATLTTPRSAQASAVRSLRFMFPDLVYESDDSTTMVNAQKELARIQYKAAGLVKGEPDVQEVRWSLDERWLRSHGVTDLF